MTAGALLPRLPLQVTAIRHTSLHLRILELCSPFSEGTTAGALLPRLPHTLPEDPGALLPILGGATAGALLPRCCFTEVYVRPRASVRVCEPVWPTTLRVVRAPAGPVSCPRLQAMSLPCPFPTACSDREHDAPMGLAQPCGVLAGAAMAGLKPSDKQCNSTAPDATAADRAHHLRWHCLRAHISRVGWRIAAAPPGHCLRAYPIRRLALSSPVVSDDTTG